MYHEADSVDNQLTLYVKYLNSGLEGDFSTFSEVNFSLQKKM